MKTFLKIILAVAIIVLTLAGAELLMQKFLHEGRQMIYLFSSLAAYLLFFVEVTFFGFWIL